MYDDILRVLENDKKKVFVSIMYHLIHKETCGIDEKDLVIDEIQEFVRYDLDIEETLIPEKALITFIGNITAKEWYALMELIRLTLFDIDLTPVVEYMNDILQKTDLTFEEKSDLIKFLKVGDEL